MGGQRRPQRLLELVLAALQHPGEQRQGGAPAEHRRGRRGPAASRPGARATRPGAGRAACRGAARPRGARPGPAARRRAGCRPTAPSGASSRPSSGTPPARGRRRGRPCRRGRAGRSAHPLDGPQPAELGQPRDDPVVGRRLRAVGEHDQDALVGEVRGEEGQQVQGGPVGPLHVLDDVGHRARRRTAGPAAQHRLEQPQPRGRPAPRRLRRSAGSRPGSSRASSGERSTSWRTTPEPRCAAPGSGRRTAAARRRPARRRPRRPRRRRCARNSRTRRVLPTPSSPATTTAAGGRRGPRQRGVQRRRLVLATHQPSARGVGHLPMMLPRTGRRGVTRVSEPRPRLRRARRRSEVPSPCAPTGPLPSVEHIAPTTPKGTTMTSARSTTRQRSPSSPQRGARASVVAASAAGRRPGGRARPPSSSRARRPRTSPSASTTTTRPTRSSSRPA